MTTDWTTELKLKALMTLPWEVRVSRSDDDAYYVETGPQIWPHSTVMQIAGEAWVTVTGSATPRALALT